MSVQPLLRDETGGEGTGALLSSHVLRKQEGILGTAVALVSLTRQVGVASI